MWPWTVLLSRRINKPSASRSCIMKYVAVRYVTPKQPPHCKQQSILWIQQHQQVQEQERRNPPAATMWTITCITSEQNQPGMTQRSGCGSFIKAACHCLLFHAVHCLLARSAVVFEAGCEWHRNSKSPFVAFLFLPLHPPPSHLILSGTLWVWLPSLWQFPAYCDRLVAPWSLRRAIAPWVSTETPLAMRLQD